MRCASQKSTVPGLASGVSVADPPIPGSSLLTVKDFPEVDALCKCALPIIFTSLDAPNFPGIHGTCFAVQFAAKVVFLTARHVVRAIDRTRIQIPTGFNVTQLVSEIAQIIYPVSNDPRFEEACDSAILVPAAAPEFVP